MFGALELRTDGGCVMACTAQLLGNHRILAGAQLLLLQQCEVLCQVASAG